jgi:tRNA acetyltransferase TAN1
VLPIEAVVPTELDTIRKAAKQLAGKIGKDTFRITVEKRHSPVESIEVIRAVAGEIESKVDLENPDWVILIQILGGQTGISVIRPDQMFSSVVEKRR